MDKAKIICDDFKLSVYELEVSEREFCFTSKEGFAQPGGKWIEVETDGLNPQHNGVLAAFAGHILHGEPLVARGEEGINGLTLSSWLGQPVTLPIDEDLFYEKLSEKIASSKVKTGESVHFDTEGTY